MVIKDQNNLIRYVVILQIFCRDEFFRFVHLAYIKALVLRMQKCDADHFYEVNFDYGALCIKITNVYLVLALDIAFYLQYITFYLQYIAS